MIGKKQRRDAWSDAEKQLLRENWQTKSVDELSTLLGRKKYGVTSMGYELGLKKSPEAIRAARVKSWIGRDSVWTEQEKQYLRDNWQTKTRQEMAVALGRTPNSVKSMGEKEMRLKKTPQAIRAIMKRQCRGNFKKGNLPYNTIYGDEQVIRIRKNKNRPPYKWIRLAFRTWKMYHVHLWETANGPTPSGHMIVFVNGDQLDVRLDNLKLITRVEHALAHSASANLPDGYVANTIAYRDKDLKEELLKHPELLELKRTQIRLNRAIRHESTGN